MAYAPTLKQLKYLCTLDRTRHFGRAAQHCHVSQSTLSAGIQELEHKLGVVLVERDNRRVMLAPLGEEIVARSQAILNHLDDLVSLCDASQEPLSGRLVDALSFGELDLLLLALPYPADNSELMPLFDDHVHLCCPEGHPLISFNSTISESAWPAWPPTKSQYRHHQGVSESCPLPPRASSGTVLALLVLGLLSSSCDRSEREEPPAMQTVKSEISYRERIALPAGTTLRVVMEDVSRMDVPATLIAQAQRDDPGAPPYRIDLDYEAAGLDPRHRYALRATIRQGDTLLFTSTEHVDALQPDDRGLVSVRLYQVPRRQSAATGELSGTLWVLRALDEKAPPIDAGPSSPTLQLASEGAQAHGFSGCNRYNGQYVRDGEQGLRFERLASTRRACPEGMALEQHYLRTLGEVRSYQQRDNTLELRDGQGNTLARFAAQPPNAAAGN